MAVARPAIYVGHPDCSISDLFEKDNIGYSVKSGHSDDLVTCLLKMLQSKKLRESMGSKARTIFEHRFDKYHAMKKWDGVLEHIRNE